LAPRRLGKSAGDENDFLFDLHGIYLALSGMIVTDNGPAGCAPYPRLLLHPIAGFEILPGMGDKGTIARMVHGLHPRNDVHHCWIMMVDMFNQFRLGVRWACYENRTCAFYRLDNAVKKILIL